MAHHTFSVQPVCRQRVRRRTPTLTSTSIWTFGRKFLASAVPKCLRVRAASDPSTDVPPSTDARTRPTAAVDMCAAAGGRLHYLALLSSTRKAGLGRRTTGAAETDGKRRWKGNRNWLGACSNDASSALVISRAVAAAAAPPAQRAFVITPAACIDASSIATRPQQQLPPRPQPLQLRSALLAAEVAGGA